MTKSEKRNFKLMSNKLSGNKDYLNLFGLISSNCKEVNAKNIEKKHLKLYPKTSINNASVYLLKQIIDSLIPGKVKADTLSNILYDLIRINILIDRNQSELALKQLKKTETEAINIQSQLMLSLCLRYRLNFLSKENFKDIDENKLIELQMQARENIKYCLNIHEHAALYELLKYRLINSGKSISEEKKARLNDLILNEINVVNSRVKNNFESQKMHLLFQSFFFTDTGDYSSAYKTFYELNTLLQKNIALQSPPIDYLSSLDGILDSLRSIENYDLMPFYIDQLKVLFISNHSENFQYLVKKSIIIYTLVYLLGKNEINKAVKEIENEEKKYIYEYRLADEEKQNELFFYVSLTYLMTKNYRASAKYINEIVLVGNIAPKSIIYRASRLLDMILQYEYFKNNEIELLIRSYKRIFKNNISELLTERLLFKVLSFNPRKNVRHRKELFWLKIEPTIEKISINKFEQQLLKYFDFSNWIKKQFGK